MKHCIWCAIEKKTDRGVYCSSKCRSGHYRKMIITDEIQEDKVKHLTCSICNKQFKHIKGYTPTPSTCGGVCLSATKSMNHKNGREKQQIKKQIHNFNRLEICFRDKQCQHYEQCLTSAVEDNIVWVCAGPQDFFVPEVMYIKSIQSGGAIPYLQNRF